MSCRAENEAAQQVTELQDALAVLQQGLQAKQLRHTKINASLQALSMVTTDGAPNHTDGVPNPERSLSALQPPSTGSAGMQAYVGMHVLPASASCLYRSGELLQ